MSWEEITEDEYTEISRANITALKITESATFPFYCPTYGEPYILTVRGFDSDTPVIKYEQVGGEQEKGKYYKWKES